MSESVTETKPTGYTILYSNIVLCVQGVQYFIQVGMCLDKDTLKVLHVHLDLLGVAGQKYLSFMLLPIDLTV